jgi:Ser/Thr protein kinase RdoA (MazF antagonist)
VAGEANEVYDVELIGDNHIIIRISRADKLEFEQERWAIEKCREVGVPVPVVLLIKHIETEQGPLHICVQEKLEGVPLERGGLDFGTFPEERKKRIIFQAGEMLAKVQNDYQANAASGISS